VPISVDRSPITEKESLLCLLQVLVPASGFSNEPDQSTLRGAVITHDLRAYRV